jgi:hypothetical protein
MRLNLAALYELDLANMRQNGVRSLAVTCLECTHKTIANMDEYPGHLNVKSFERRMACSKCGIRSVEVRPNWLERPNRPSLLGTGSG